MIVKYYNVEVIDASFKNDYTAADGTYYPPRYDEWGWIAVTDYEVFFIQTASFGLAKVLHIFRLDEASTFLKIIATIPPDADNIKLFCRAYGDLFIRSAGDLERNFYQLFKDIL